MDDAEVFLTDLANRMSGRIQLSTDGHRIYEGIVGPSFANDVDWAQIQKHYAGGEPGKYSPPVCIGTKRRVLKGEPDPDRISTSYVERQNLTMRMGMRRFARLTNGFSEKVENLAHSVSLHFMHYNFARPHQALKGTLSPDSGGRGDRSRLELGRDRGVVGLTLSKQDLLGSSHGSPQVRWRFLAPCQGDPGRS
jgi:hypothetical protein